MAGLEGQDNLDLTSFCAAAVVVVVKAVDVVVVVVDVIVVVVVVDVFVVVVIAVVVAIVAKNSLRHSNNFSGRDDEVDDVLTLSLEHTLLHVNHFNLVPNL